MKISRQLTRSIVCVIAVDHHLSTAHHRLTWNNIQALLRLMGVCMVAMGRKEVGAVSRCEGWLYSLLIEVAWRVTTASTVIIGAKLIDIYILFSPRAPGRLLVLPANFLAQQDGGEYAFKFRLSS